MRVAGLKFKVLSSEFKVKGAVVRGQKETSSPSPTGGGEGEELS